MKGNTTLPDQFQTYIDHAWEGHAAKLEELNGLAFARQVIDQQIERASLELQALAERASEALPWGPEIESQDWTGQAPAGLEWLEE